MVPPTLKLRTVWLSYDGYRVLILCIGVPKNPFIKVSDVSPIGLSVLNVRSYTVPDSGKKERHWFCLPVEASWRNPLSSWESTIHNPKLIYCYVEQALLTT